VGCASYDLRRAASPASHRQPSVGGLFVLAGRALHLASHERNRSLGFFAVALALPPHHQSDCIVHAVLQPDSHSRGRFFRCATRQVCPLSPGRLPELRLLAVLSRQPTSMAPNLITRFWTSNLFRSATGSFSPQRLRQTRKLSGWNRQRSSA
jgi:hypothetical protein